MMVLLVICHWIACTFFYLGNLDMDSSWIKDFGFEGDFWVYQYLVALHFSLTQFTPASMHVQPTNLLERSFTVGLVLFALFGFSYIVGSMSGSLTQLRGIHAKQHKQFWELR